MADEPYRLPGDQGNPYAPPETELTPLGPPGADYTLGGETEPFSATAAVGRAFRIIKERWALTIGSVLTVFAVSFVYQFFAGMLLGGMQTAGVSPASLQSAQIGMGFFGNLVQLYLTIGQSLLMLKVARNLPAQFTEIFQGGRYFWRYLVASILVGVLLIAALAAVGVPALVTYLATRGSGSDGAFWVVGAFCLAGGLALVLYLSARLGQYGYAIVDRDAGIVDSLRISSGITKGKVVEVIGLYLLGGLINLLGLLACFVGLLFTIPMVTLAMACAYVQLTGTGGKPVVPGLRDDLEFSDSQPWTPTA